jgi:hypothetical protein
MKYLILLLVAVSSSAQAACESGYTTAVASASISEGVISKIYQEPASYSGGICLIQVKVGFSSLKENGSAATCKETLGSRINSTSLVANLQDCINVQQHFVKSLMTAFVLGRKLSASLDSFSSITYSAAGGITLQ